MHDVFLSYKSEDYEMAKKLQHILDANGISCWIAPDCIPGGSNYGEEIPKAIEGCTVVVLVLSEKSQTSPWISKEINLALNCHKTIMPFMIEDFALQNQLFFYLSDVQHYSAFKSWDDAVAMMISDIGRLLGVDEPGYVTDPGKKKKPAKEKKAKNVYSSGNNTKIGNSFGIWLLIGLAYLWFIPGGLITTVSYFTERHINCDRVHNYKITKILSIISIVFGIILFVNATINYTHCSEAYYVSVFGIIVELVANM